MKSTLKFSLTALAGLAVSASPALAITNLAPGDLAIAFYSFETTPQGSSIPAPETYVVNLGNAGLYRENTASGVSLSTINPALASSNIGADLAATFGEDWADRNNGSRVYWLIVGTVPFGNPTVNGDPARTNYISRSRDSLAVGETGPKSTIATISPTNRGTLSNGVVALSNGINGAIAASTFTQGANAAGATFPTSIENGVEDLTPPEVLGTYFGQGVNPRQVFATGALAGGAGVEGALDIYRVLHSTDGADLTAGGSSGNAVVGAGQYIGSITIDSAGNLRMAALGTAVTNPDTDNDGLPDAWEMTNFGNLNETATGDFDGDGTNNLTEYRLGLDPKSGSSRFAVTRQSSGALQWPSATGLTFVVQRSTTLLPGSWGNDFTVSGTAGTATYTDPAPPAGKAFYRVLLQP